MSRINTPQEWAAFYERRQKDLEKTAANLGMTTDELEELHQRIRKEFADRHRASKQETEEALKVAMSLADRGTAQPAPSETAIVDDMSVEEFGAAMAHYFKIVDNDLDRQLVTKAVARRIACWRGGEAEPMTLREEIMLDLQSMTLRFGRK